MVHSQTRTGSSVASTEIVVPYILTIIELTTARNTALWRNPPEHEQRLYFSKLEIFMYQIT
jgi:hypothetical protein